jgi:hypothetical protein
MIAESTSSAYAAARTPQRDAYYTDSDAVFPHFAAGDSWDTILVIVNMSTRRIDFTQAFKGADGQPIEMTFRAIPGGALSTSSRTQGFLLPGGSLNVLLVNNGPLKTGWATLEYDPALGRLGAYMTFRQRVTGRPDYEALVPLSSYLDTRFFLPIDNLEGYSTAIAVANPGNIASTVRMSLLNTAGAVVATDSLTIPAQGQTAFTVVSRFPAAAGQIGTLLVEGSTTRLSGMGLRFSPSGAFSSVPIMNWEGMLQ